MRNTIKKIANNISTKGLRLSRKMYAKDDLAEKKKSCSFKGLTDEQKDKIKDYWNGFGVKNYDIEWFDFYTTLTDIFDPRYIPGDIYLAYVDPYFNNADACKHIDNKNLYDLIFNGVKMPNTILRKMDGVFLDENYAILTEEQALDKCYNSNLSLILKPSLISTGGHGIKFWNKGTIETLKSYLSSKNDIIVQEVLQQHETLSLLHPNSLNTIRIMTLYYNNKVSVLSSVVRIGVNGNKVDNVSSGGVACGVDQNGKLKEYAFYGNGNKISVHPQGAVFKKFQIPSFFECKSIAQQMAMRIINYSRLVSWDFSIDKNGVPVLIEANLNVGELDFHQLSNGPIFGSDTDEILSDIFHKK